MWPAITLAVYEIDAGGLHEVSGAKRGGGSADERLPPASLSFYRGTNPMSKQPLSPLQKPRCYRQLPSPPTCVFRGPVVAPYALVPEKQLTFPWLNPSALQLYGVIFEEIARRTAEAEAKMCGSEAPACPKN